MIFRPRRHPQTGAVMPMPAEVIRVSLNELKRCPTCRAAMDGDVHADSLRVSCQWGDAA